MPARAFSALSQRAGTALTAVLIASSLAGCSSGSSSSSSPTSQLAGASGFDGAALPPGVAAPAFTLTDQHGRSVSLAGLRGQVAIVAFVYSTCGSTCVVIAQQIRGALDELAHPVPVLFVSADPAADTPAHVSRFLSRVSLSARVSYLSGSPARLRPLWHAFRVVSASGDRRAFDRTASVYLIDRAGRERVIYQLEQLTPEAISHDVRKLLE
ncbi:MAG TPA: SCO family protein [Solirubrobacteraceae bacterium]|jgi:protein SCO1/2|nr:SCO family protein [Solirubrobacteraceae bacterium]